MTTSNGCENWPPPVPFLPNGAVTHNFPRAFDVEHTIYSECCNTARSYIARPMNKDESDRIHELRPLITVEQDRRKFLDLVEELNRILSAQDRRLQSTRNQDQE
jgi:hypothetical protein